MKFRKAIGLKWFEYELVTLHRTWPFFVQHTLFHGEKEDFKVHQCFHNFHKCLWFILSHTTMICRKSFEARRQHAFQRNSMGHHGTPWDTCPQVWRQLPFDEKRVHCERRSHQPPGAIAAVPRHSHRTSPSRHATAQVEGGGQRAVQVARQQ